MCGRARCTLNPQQISAAALGLSPTAAASVPTRDIDRHRPSYNVAPGAYLPVFVVRKDGDGQAGAPIVWCMKWGLIPSFTKKTEKPDHYRMFNARSESVKEKASFRRLIPNNRCLVAVEGFYEWKKDGSKKQPYYIHFKDHRPLVFAALFDSWENSEGEVLHTFTILTTRSSSALQWLHERMPVILGDYGSIDAWLNNSSPKLETILRPYEDPDLVWYPVTPAMGKPSFDGIECIKEIQIKSGGEKSLSMFFSKKTDVKCQKEPEHMKSSEEVKEEPMKSYEELKEEPMKSSEEVKEGPMKSYEELKEEPMKSSDEDAFSSLKEESDADDCQQKVVKEEKKEGIEPETCGIKREYEEIAGSSRMTNDPSGSEPVHPAKKKGRSVKNTGDKQASLLSYFGRR